MPKPIVSRLRGYVHLTRSYWGEAQSFMDFVRVMRVRLSQSKLGPIVCPRPIVVSVDLASFGTGVLLRSHTTDISVLGELLVGKSYLPAAEASDETISTIVDLGANTGLVARWFLERFPAARIVSVEPEPSNVETLRLNLAPYGERAQVIAACVGAHERNVALDTSRGEFGVTMLELDDPEMADDARVITMESVISALGSDTIDLLKCDVEGAERELFESGGDWISTVNLMSVECHEPFTPDLLIALLEEDGYEVATHHLESTLDFGAETLTLSLGRSDAA